jgi:flagellar basal-body rod protein FlgB
MMLGGVYSQNDILGLAMQAASVRDSVHANNLANNDTVGYKKYAVAFEDRLQAAIDDYKRTGTLDLSTSAPVVQRIETNLSNRLDGNNVDINEESAAAYLNSIRYDMLADSLIANYRQIKMVFDMR